MKERILNNWNILRFIRLALGIAITVQGALAGSWSFAILGVLLTIMPLLNYGSCNNGACAVPPRKSKFDTR